MLGGKAFGPAVPVLRLQAVALLGGFLAATWSYTLLSLRMHGALLRVTLAALVVSIALSAAFVPSLGAKGASIASAVCEFVVAGGYLLALVAQACPPATELRGAAARGTRRGRGRLRAAAAVAEHRAVGDRLARSISALCSSCSAAVPAEGSRERPARALAHRRGVPGTLPNNIGRMTSRALIAAVRRRLILFGPWPIRLATSSRR